MWNLREPPKRKKVYKELTSAFHRSLFSVCQLPKADWSALATEPQLFMMGNSHLSVGFTHFCMMEVRLLITGTEIVCGLPYTIVPGESFREKRRSVYMATTDQISSWVQQGGFRVVHENTNALVIPNGFIVVAASTNAVGIRWSFSTEEADLERASYSLTQLLESFPEMRNASIGYGQFLDYLAAH